MNPAPAYYCPICNVQLDVDKVIGPNLDGTTPPHDPPGADLLVPFVFCEGTGTPPVVCDHVDACPADCPGSLDARRWATFHDAHERRTTHRGLILVVRLPPSFPSWAAYQDVACRVFVDGGQAAGLRDAERRAVAAIDEAFRTVAPPCLTGMGCLCAGHVRGDAPQVRCDTSEAPGARPESVPRARPRKHAPRRAEPRERASRREVIAAALADINKATARKGHFIVGETPKGDAIAVPDRVGRPVTRAMLHEMFIEMKKAGLPGKLHVYGTHTTISEDRGGRGRFRFHQIDARTGRRINP